MSGYSSPRTADTSAGPPSYTSVQSVSHEDLRDKVVLEMAELVRKNPDTHIASRLSGLEDWLPSPFFAFQVGYIFLTIQINQTTIYKTRRDI